MNKKYNVAINEITKSYIKEFINELEHKGILLNRYTEELRGYGRLITLSYEGELLIKDLSRSKITSKYNRLKEFPLLWLPSGIEKVAKDNQDYKVEYNNIMVAIELDKSVLNKMLISVIESLKDRKVLKLSVNYI